MKYLINKPKYETGKKYYYVDEDLKIVQAKLRNILCHTYQDEYIPEFYVMENGYHAMELYPNKTGAIEEKKILEDLPF